jgi:hypothetical protein
VAKTVPNRDQSVTVGRFGVRGFSFDLDRREMASFGILELDQKSRETGKWILRTLGVPSTRKLRSESFMTLAGTRSFGATNLLRLGWKPWFFCGGNILKADKSLNPDFKEFLTLLLDEKTEFALIGGYAVAYHGYPRFTGDMDILIARNSVNAAKILKVLGRFGFGSLQITQVDLETEGLDNPEIFAGLIVGEFYGLKVPIISKEHLIRNKRASGRPRDLLDLENLE